MNYRKESGSRDIQALSPRLLTMIVKIRLKHVTPVLRLIFHTTQSYRLCHSVLLCRTFDLLIAHSSVLRSAI